MSYDPINDSEAMDRFNKLQIDLANYDPKEEKIKDDKMKCGPYYVDNLTNEEYANWKELRIKRDKSYIIQSNSKEALKKFMFIYIMATFKRTKGKLMFKSVFNDYTLDNFSSSFEDIIDIFYVNKFYKYSGEWYNEQNHYELIAKYLVDSTRGDSISIVLTEKPIEVVYLDNKRSTFNFHTYLEDEIETIILNKDLSRYGINAKKDNSMGLGWDTKKSRDWSRYDK